MSNNLRNILKTAHYNARCIRYRNQDIVISYREALSLGLRMAWAEALAPCPVESFIRAEGLDSEAAANLRELVGVYTDRRIDLSTLRVSGGWVAVDATVSDRTLGKFDRRFKSVCRHSFSRGGRVGFRA